jgi:cysteinyl-tRNA synthetase
MKLYNTLTRSVDEFQPRHKKVSLYSCGPTVYDQLTIGNWTSYVRWDVLARTLRRLYGLNWYMNITDVGHLVSDADEGEDKLEKGAEREGRTAWEIADKYTRDFIKGLDELNITVPKSHLIKATDHIDEQIALIQKLETKGYAYVIDDGVYFDSSKFADYGKMARLDLEGLQAGARVNIGQKKHSTDFALWKFTPSGRKRDMQWDSPWGKGFPGWHIECSAMAMKYLGETIDIHTGGIDHIPIHHTNEIAQSEAVTGRQFVRFWLHSNFLQVEGTKIAKSLGNGYTLGDLRDKGFSSMDFRLFVLQSHFQTEANFTWEGLKGAQTRLKDLQAMADLRFQTSDRSVDQSVNQIEAIKDIGSKIKEALTDNLNTPLALSHLSAFVTKLEGEVLNQSSHTEFMDLLSLLDDLLGLKLTDSEDITEAQKWLIEEREQVRAQKDWEKSDWLRDKLSNQGIGLNDTGHGTVWRRV